MKYILICLVFSLSINSSDFAKVKDFTPIPMRSGLDTFLTVSGIKSIIRSMFQKELNSKIDAIKEDEIQNQLAMAKMAILKHTHTVVPKWYKDLIPAQIAVHVAIDICDDHMALFQKYLKTAFILKDINDDNELNKKIDYFGLLKNRFTPFEQDLIIVFCYLEAERELKKATEKDGIMSKAEGLFSRAQVLLWASLRLNKYEDTHEESILYAEKSLNLAVEAFYSEQKNVQDEEMLQKILAFINKF